MNATTRRRLSLSLIALSGVLLVGGCSGGSSDAGSSAGGSAQEAPQSGTDSVTRDGSDLSAAVPASGQAAAGQPLVTERLVISTGAITLQSDDIAAARQDAIDVVTGAGGHIDNETSVSGDDGTMTSSNLVFRVPAQQFDTVMDQLAGVADAVRQSRKAEDVTTRVIDVAARIRVQQASIRRLETLYARATTIGQIISLENQLSKRQADLDSLKQRQAWLRNQTSLSTIELKIVEPPATEPAPATERHGFLKGLYAGWDALVAVTTAALATVGAVLPFLGVLLLLAAAYRVARRVRS